MISPAKKQVFISCDDGSLELFKPEELQSQIYRACIQCGFDDSWFSEDIALSVEYLIIEEGKKTDFSKQEIFLFTSRLLEETGYANIALRLRKNCGITRTEDSICGVEAVSAYLLNCGHFGCDSQQIDSLSTLVVSALKRLGIKKPGEELLLALAKHFTKNSSLLKLASQKAVRNGILIISKEEITEKLVLNVNAIAEWKAAEVITFHPVSTLFPSLKISFSLAKFADMKALLPPLTELAIMPHFGEIAGVLDESRQQLRGVMLASEIKQDLPVIMRVTDSIEFAKEYMGSESGDDKFIKELLNSLKDLISGELIIK